jgi:protein phosphatase
VAGFDNIEYASLTDVGVRRSHNQDAYAVLPATDADQWQGRGHLFLVADGMGAHAVGELASKLAVDGIPHIYTKYVQDGPIAALRKAFVETNVSIHNRGQQNREFEGMGTTATALVISPEGAWVGHVGDSRAYRVRDGRIEQLSFDHSLVWELARRQHVRPEELQGIPTNVIVRSLGPEPLVQVDIEGPHPLRAGDVFVLCSDGLSGPVSDREIGAAVSTLPPHEACRFLVDLANLQGGPDNITVLVVRVDRVPPNGKPPRRAAPWYLRPQWPMGALLASIALAALAIVLHLIDVPLVMPLFLLAALALSGGLVGLLVQSHQEKNAPPEEEARPLQIHRQHGCGIDNALVHKIARALATVEGRVRERQWEADWEQSRTHREQAERLLRGGDLPGAFREFCRAMLPLTETLQKYRQKEESFKPLWDKGHE